MGSPSETPCAAQGALQALRPARALHVAFVAAVFGGACLGEDNAVFVGTVTVAAEGDAAEVTFDEWPNPDELAPIEGAIVELCLDSCGESQSDVTDARGRWGRLSSGVFALDTGDGPTFHITVRAPGFEPFNYQLRYGDAEPQETNGSHFMNVRLVPNDTDPPAP